VEVSSDGLHWTNLETAGIESEAYWKVKKFRLENIIGLPSQLQFRFPAAGNKAALDRFKIVGYHCDNRDSLFNFMEDFKAGRSEADLNEDGVVNALDLNSFLGSLNDF
jgi:hypothetical protein